MNQKMYAIANESCVSNEPKVETRTNAIIANFRSESYIGNV